MFFTEFPNQESFLFAPLHPQTFPLQLKLTKITEKGPLKRCVFTPSRYFSWETTTCTAAAVVKPRTRGSVR